MEAIEFLNAADARPTRGISPNDHTHRVVFNGIYELAFGRGRGLAAGRTGLVAKLLEGWQIEAVYQRNSDPLGFGNYIFNGDPNPIALPASQQTAERRSHGIPESEYHPGPSAFGQVTSSVNYPRTIQFGFVVRF